MFTSKSKIKSAAKINRGNYVDTAAFSDKALIAAQNEQAPRNRSLFVVVTAQPCRCEEGSCSSRRSDLLSLGDCFGTPALAGAVPGKPKAPRSDMIVVRLAAEQLLVVNLRSCNSSSYPHPHVRDCDSDKRKSPRNSRSGQVPEPFRQA